MLAHLSTKSFTAAIPPVRATTPRCREGLPIPNPRDATSDRPAADSLAQFYLRGGQPCVACIITCTSIHDPRDTSNGTTKDTDIAAVWSLDVGLGSFCWMENEVTTCRILNTRVWLPRSGSACLADPWQNLCQTNNHLLLYLRPLIAYWTRRDRRSQAGMQSVSSPSSASYTPRREAAMQARGRLERGSSSRDEACQTRPGRGCLSSSTTHIVTRSATRAAGEAGGEVRGSRRSSFQRAADRGRASTRRRKKRTYRGRRHRRPTPVQSKSRSPFASNGPIYRGGGETQQRSGPPAVPLRAWGTARQTTGGSRRSTGRKSQEAAMT